jgi:cellulose synthase/poly-beta-1,6-N-acetylglucosamine synthase-like glycosyltransferase
MTPLMEAAFWWAVAMLAYAYAGFPLLVGLVGLWQRREVAKESKDRDVPSVTVIIAAFNEEAAIAARLDNVLASDYPSDHLEVIVADDGSTDGTGAIVESYRDRGVRLLSLPRRGKIPALNDAAATARGEILVFSDANIHCHPSAIGAMVRNFADPGVGGVAGHCTYLVAARTESSGDGERMYWRYDTWLKQLESHTGSVVSAHGGLYAVRRRLFTTVTDSSVTDDFAISTAVIEQGYRLVFEADARAVEHTTTEARREMRRRVRLMTRGLRAVCLRRRLLNPFRYGFYAISLFSHKVLRRLAPVWLVVIALATSMLAAAGNWFFIAIGLAQLAFYGLAIAGGLLRRRRIGRLKPLCVPFYYCMANAASALALWHFLKGTRISLWQPQRFP